MKRILRVVIGLTAVSCGGAKVGPAMIAATPATIVPKSDDLGRGAPFSLTISGGISLGAYEAGLNWVLVEWLKTKQRDHTASSASGPLVGVSGASAGAVNALLTAIRWCEESPSTSIDDNPFSNTWRTVGLDGLLPDDEKPYVGLSPPQALWDPDFLFARKNAFEDVLGNVQKRLAARTYIPGCSVRLSLMVTKVSPRRITVEGLTTNSQRLVIPLVVTAQPDKSLRFELNRQLLADDQQRNLIGEVLFLPPESERSPFISSDDVLKGVLASAAHPSSFGPVLLDHCTPVDECPGDRQIKSGEARCASLRGVLAEEAGAAPGRLVMCSEPFIDGGAFDNVPLGMAMAQAESLAFPSSGDGSSLPVHYIYLDPSVRRPSADQTDCSKGGSAPGPVRRDPIGELVTFVGGMISSASDYELHNVLRFNKWNLTPLRIAKKARTLVDQLCAQASSHGADCAQAHEKLDAADNLGSGVVKAEQQGDPTAWKVDLAGFLDAVWAALDAVAPALPAEKGARVPWSAQRRDIAELRKTPSSARVLQIPNRFPPITGALLAHFAAFLDRPFRDYDYYAGLYDGVVAVANWSCEGCGWPARKIQIEQWMTRLGIGAGAGESKALADAFLSREDELSAHASSVVCAKDGEDAPVVHKMLEGQTKPEEQVKAALEESSRCGFTSGVCLRDVDFDRFISNLSQTGYEAVSPIAKRAIAHTDDWWTEPASRGAARLEIVSEARPANAPLDAPVATASSAASLLTQHWYNETHDPWYFRPPSDASEGLVRLFSPSVSIATTTERYLSLGFFSYGLGSRHFVAQADLSLRAGVRVDGDRLRMYSLDGTAGPAWIGGLKFSSVDARVGASLASIGDVPLRYSYEVGAGFFLNHLRLSAGLDSDGPPQWDHKYLKVTLADISGLLEGLF